ncbi:16S rRNA (cytidine(1402)-2'-O)-methyltransferase [Candidatus Woesearchaeota archaeon]|nr:16S rRNA (cytidine(1402)-2'-O)-methyltransferase [Candidatus Woesearchaeota archaeon]
MTLFVCATPIGNLDDVSFRLLETLKKVDLICAEDTRRTKKLLDKYNVKYNKMTSYNDANKKIKTKHIIEELNQNRDVALVSDSGTPCISDPGYYLVSNAVVNGIAVVPVPGPNAMIAALSISGMATDRFTFYGFLPKTSGKQMKILEEIKKRNETAVIYESQYRIVKTLNAINTAMPDKQLVLCRELTKKFEEQIRGTAGQILEKIKNKKIKGEIVLIIGKS